LMNSVQKDTLSLQGGGDHSDTIVTLPGYSVMVLELELP